MLNKRLLISAEMLKYIRDSTNKSLEKYLNKYNINALELNNRTPNCIILMPIVSLVSFLAGYNFCNFLQKLTN